MEMFKKPYEISLWEDELIWHTRELEPIKVLEKDYAPGKFFSQNPTVAGEIPYTLDYQLYNEGQQYFQIKSNGKVREGNSSQAVNIENIEEWKNTEIIKVVKRPVNGWGGDIWYTYSNTEDVFTLVDTTRMPTPEPNKIYFVDKAKGTFYIPNVLQTFYKETKIATIGSNTMDSPARCVNPKLTRKVNGENTLTFTMYYSYWDNEAQDFIYNPFNDLMVNERKIKLRLGSAVEKENDNSCQWFDFIIKNVQENSETRAFTYTCKDQFVNELSKSGFEIELDNELENNMGTIEVLAKHILEGSDWVVTKEENQDLKQYKEEPLYKIKVSGKLTATSLEKVGEGSDKKYATLDSLDGKYIYVFYSIITNKKKKIQFLYLPDDQQKFVTDDNLIIDRELYLNYELDGEFEYTLGDNKQWPSFTGLTNGKLDANISSEYRGERLVKQFQTKYDSTIDKYVGVYEKEGKQYSGYTQSEYISSGMIINYIANPSNFTSTSGWQTDAKQLDYQLVTTKNSQTGLYESFIKVDFNDKEDALVMNAGIGGNRSNIGQFVEGEKYVLRMKYKQALDGNYMNTAPEVKICEYRFGSKEDGDKEGRYILEENAFFNFSPMLAPAHTNDIDEDGNYIVSPNEGYAYAIATCSRSISQTQLSDWDFKIGLFFDFKTPGEIYIEDVQVFSYETYEDNGTRLCVPGGKLHSEIKTKYIYYEPDVSMESIKDLRPVYSEYEDDTSFVQQYGIDGAEGNEFTKVRSISAKESNRFNLIQELCETFECWPKLTVKRNQSTGQIYYGKDTYTIINESGEEEIRFFEQGNPYRQQKFISFREYTGKENFVGFRYGINSKSIQRTIDSAAIVSKMIVKDNANEFAPNGFCSIARASENPTGENFLLNFDHYIRHKLLDFEVITNDLYVNANGYLGYYQKLKQINIDRDRKIDEQAGLLIDISNYNSAYTTYKTSYDSAVEEQLIVEKDFCKLVGKEISHEHFGNSKDDSTNPGADGLATTDEQRKYWTKWCQCQNIIVQHKPLYEKAKLNLDDATAEYNDIAAYLKNIATQKQALALQFYKKYSRFIQEGSWIKKDYTDPNLYYLDSESTLHTSAQPKVTYNINIIDVSPLEGYVDYEFDIGDRTYIEDVEFFGWSLSNRATPYREEIIVSEIVTELDAPEKNQIKVQNYKTQFEDLFQRITAQTQQAEYHTGEYTRAASVVEPNGLISVDSLQNSFANNSFILSNARDQSVVWDSSGITTTSLSNPSEMVRIVSGGVFLSIDGGLSWKTGITGNGINTSYLTAGQINTNIIQILNGANTAFRWDEKGLAAYDKYSDSGLYNYNKFVRFDHNGIYGWTGVEEGQPENVSDIYRNAPFALTWDGFSLKNEDGSVRISTTDDIQVLEGEIERIKIGRLSNGVYGICISDNSGPIMETGNEGTLWLKKALYIETTEGEVSIGKLGKNESEDKFRVIDANNEFIVYESGDFIANKATIQGTIDAQGGSIGAIEITPDGLVIQSKEEDESRPIVELNKNGLSIYNEGMRIIANEETVLSVQDGQLNLKGQIIATAGGKIGGFNINESNLSSANGEIILNGQDNTIYAKNIKLGVHAEIEEYIQLGNAYIRNPIFASEEIEPSHIFIETEGLTIFDNGILQIGDNIVLDGPKESIYSKNYAAGSAGWKINEDSVEFNDATIRGTLKTSVLSHGEVQSVGGMILVRPSSKVKETEIDEETNEIWILLEDESGFNIDDICQLNQTVCRIKNIRIKDDRIWLSFSTVNGNIISGWNPQKGDVLVNYSSSEFQFFENEDGFLSGEFGYDEKFLDSSKSFHVYGSLLALEESQTVLTNNIGIAINASDNNSAFPGQAITIFESELDEQGELQKHIRIKLGRMNGEPSFGRLQGYGLYAENVYLHGSLVTKLEDSSSYYSGFNGDSNIIEEETGANILLWAGAPMVDSNPDIRNAPFRVDHEGNMFASKGQFSGSVISNSYIEASEIRTAVLTGDGVNPALRIIDTSEGIEFCDYIAPQGEAQAQYKTTFKIVNSGLQTEVDKNVFENFIDLSNDNIVFSTKKTQSAPKIIIKENEIKWGIFSIKEEFKLKTEQQKSVLNLGKENLQIQIDEDENKILINSSFLEFGEQNMRYEKVESGYNLYVL